MTCAWCGGMGPESGVWCDKCVDPNGRKIAMRDYIEIGSSPYGEDCAQVGRNDYSVRSNIECKVFAAQLQRIWPDGQFGVKSFPHDYGTYREVVAYFYEDDEHLTNIAYEAESNTPEFWDDVAKAELRKQCAEAGIDAPQFVEENAY